MQQNERPCTYEARISFPDRRHAEIVAEVISTDAELRPKQVDRRLTVKDAMLVIQVDAIDAKVLRTAVTSLYDFIRVSIEALAIMPR